MVETELKQSRSSSEVSRTYEDFQKLRELLVQENWYCPVPLLPEMTQFLKMKALDSPEIAELKV